MNRRRVELADVGPEHLAPLRSCCLALPEVWEERAWAGTRFLVRRRSFAHVFAVGGEGDVATLLAFRSPDEERDVLVGSGHPFFPIGSGRGAVGMVLDLSTDWDEVRELVVESYCVLAPRRLVALVEPPDATETQEDTTCER